MTTLTVKTPTLDEMREVARELGFKGMGDDDLRLHLKMLEGNFAAYNVVDGMSDELPEVRYPRTPGRRPPPEENPLPFARFPEKEELLTVRVVPFSLSIAPPSAMTLAPPTAWLFVKVHPVTVRVAPF